jgi:hypothetical protein
MKLAFAQIVDSFIFLIPLATSANQQRMLNPVCYALDFTSMELIAIIAMKLLKVLA